MTRQIIRITLIIVLTLLFMFFPFLPGKYDHLAVTLLFMAQLLGVAGLILVPIGVLWLVYELRRQASQFAKGRGGYYFALASLVASSIVVVIVSLPAYFDIGRSFGIAFLVLWTYFVLKILPGMKLLKHAEPRNFMFAPLYLICIPITVLLLRLTLIGPATEFSRNYAITQSEELINDIEKYYNANGHYPISLASVWKDYKPSVIGIEQFYYEPNGNAYNVFFEQFTFQLDTREIVMYNKFDQQVITSHDSWILVLSPGELERTRGYYAAHEASKTHWKYFWFD